MATETKLEVGILEKLGEKFSNFAEGLTKFVTRLAGTSDERATRALGFIRTRDPNKPYNIASGSILAKINDLEPKMQALSDEELKGLSIQFRERLKNGATLEQILPEAYAACREAGRRTKGMRHYDVQMVGGVILHRGGIAEMVTGEGKTLVATLPAYLNAITGMGVHVITVNDYLARRDCEWMTPIYSALGVRAGFIQSDMDPSDRRRAYECDITYGTNSEFGFDYLRDNMKPARWDDPKYADRPWYRQVQRNLNYAIIDEVDNILIDEARTPLIISGPAFSDLRRYEDADRIARLLTDMEKKARADLAAAGKPIDAPLKAGEKRELGVYFEVKEKEKSVQLTDAGVREAERLAGVESFYTAGNMEWPHLIDNSLKAHHLYLKDRDYLVIPHPETRKMSIIIVDTHTGRALFGRQWSDGLHQAVEAKHKKEGVAVKQETQTLATVTLQNFFKLYNKLGGMTGTAMTEANEFWKIYKLDVVAIPTNRIMKRINHPDLVYLTEKEKWDAIMKEIVEVHESGRPILIGTTDVAKSERLATLLRRKGIKFELLNAKPENVTRESEIVAQAGRIGAVTIATNMAGRGTDIILGGNPEYMAWAQLKDKYATRLDVPDDVWKSTVDAIEARDKMKDVGRQVASLGGLHIIGTERHESRRIDNQLRGRSGRQGDPGSSRFFLSLQDDLMRLFAGEWVAGILTRLGMKEGEAIESKMVTKRIQAAQKKVEEYHFEQRKNLLEYDEVMDTQRKRVYGKRQEILNDRNCKIEILRMIDKQIDKSVDTYLDPNYGTDSFRAFAADRLGVEFDGGEFNNTQFEIADRMARDKAIRHIPTVIQEGMDENLSLEEDPNDWKWQEMARTMAVRYGLKIADRDLKKIGRENLSQYLFDEATKSIEAVDLNEGKRFFERNWGLVSLIEWVRIKFLVNLEQDALLDKDERFVQVLIRGKVHEAYRAKEMEFPVRVAMSQYMAEKAAVVPGQQRYNREGLFLWAKQRFPQASENLSEEFFRTESRAKILELVTSIAQKSFPTVDQRQIDTIVEDAFSGAKVSEAADAQEMSDWMRNTFQINIPAEKLTGVSLDVARHTLWNAYDDMYRQEMHKMERLIYLDFLDNAWKNQLLTMDHLRSGIGLRGYAQEDPKTVYKKEGMSEFEQMWVNLDDRITDIVFRMDDLGEEAMQEAMWTGAVASHAQAQSLTAAAKNTNDPLANVSTNAVSETRSEPIRNMGAKVGRNDPCPCGSGKKYKNCHLRMQQADK